MPSLSPLAPLSWIGHTTLQELKPGSFLSSWSRLESLHTLLAPSPFPFVLSDTSPALPSLSLFMPLDAGRHTCCHHCSAPAVAAERGACGARISWEQLWQWTGSPSLPCSQGILGGAPPLPPLLLSLAELGSLHSLVGAEHWSTPASMLGRNRGSSRQGRGFWAWRGREKVPRTRQGWILACFGDLKISPQLLLPQGGPKKYETMPLHALWIYPVVTSFR